MAKQLKKIYDSSSSPDTHSKEALISELLKKNQQLEAIFDGIADYIFILDENGCFLDFNKSVTEDLGYYVEELAGKSFEN